VDLGGFYGIIAGVLAAVFLVAPAAVIRLFQQRPAGRRVRRELPSFLIPACS